MSAAGVVAAAVTLPRVDVLRVAMIYNMQNVVR